MTEEKKSLHIVELRTENVKRIEAVAIRPDSSVVIIGGRNGQGKTSLLDSIEMALGGGKAIPPDPVRHGARKARIVADLGEIVVERTFGPNGTKLVVKNADGSTVKSPQKLLDDLCAKVTFDPLEFSRMKAPEQDKLMKKLLDLDFSDLEKKRATAYEERTAVNRDVKRLEVRLDEFPDFSGVPDKEVSVADLLAKVEAAEASVAANDKRRDEFAMESTDLLNQESRRRHQSELIDRLKRELAEAKKDMVDMEAIIDVQKAVVADLNKEVDALEDPSTDELHTQIKTAEATNKTVRKKEEFRRVETEMHDTMRKADELTEVIQSCDEQKDVRLSEAKFPVPGLGFDDTGVTLDGVPFEQASGAEKLRVSVAIGAALNPRVKVMLVRDGSLLDEDSMKLLKELAEETNSQVWIERVSTDGAGCSVVIEDGSAVP